MAAVLLDCSPFCLTTNVGLKPPPHSWAQQEVQSTLAEVVRDNSSAGAVDESVSAYVSGLATHLINARDFSSDTWTNKVHNCSAP